MLVINSSICHASYCCSVYNSFGDVLPAAAGTLLDLIVHVCYVYIYIYRERERERDFFLSFSTGRRSNPIDCRSCGAPNALPVTLLDLFVHYIVIVDVFVSLCLGSLYFLYSCLSLQGFSWTPPDGGEQMDKGQIAQQFFVLCFLCCSHTQGRGNPLFIKG